MSELILESPAAAPYATADDVASMFKAPIKRALEMRDYQTRAKLAYYNKVRAGAKRVMLCSPTGSGKTEIAMDIIQDNIRAGNSVDFFVDRDNLVWQTSKRFSAADIQHGIVKGKDTVGANMPIRIISQQTAVARKMELTAKVNIVDEAHVVYDWIVRELMRTQGFALGMSASPMKDGLGDIYEDVVNVSSTYRLINEKWLAPLKVYCGKPIAVEKKSSTGEYDAAAASEAAVQVVGDVIDEWEKHTAKHFGGPVEDHRFRQHRGGRSEVR